MEEQGAPRLAVTFVLYCTPVQKKMGQRAERVEERGAREVGGPTVPVLLGRPSARNDAAQVSVSPYP